jgi:hypothetical protein
VSQYFYNDFSGLPTGATARYNTTPDWTGSNPFLIPRGVANDWTGLSINELDSDSGRANFDVQVSFTTPSTLQTTRFLFFRGSGADESATHLHFSLLSGAHSLGYCSGSDTRVNIVSHSASYSGSTTYRARINCNGSTLRTKVWLNGDEEPASWQIDTVDGTVTAAGWIGFCQNGNVNQIAINWLGVGTGGDSAPTSPLSSGTTVEPGDGSIAVQGFAPAIGQPVSITPGAGAIAVQGFAPSVVQAAQIRPGAGSIAVQGFTPAIGQPVSIQPGDALIEVQGFAPSVVQAVQIRPGAGSIAVQGFTPAIGQPVSIQPGDALIEVRGFSPEVSQAAQIRPGAGSIAVQGFAPAIGQPVSIQPGDALIEVRGFSPEVSQAAQIRPGAGSIEVQGFAPAIGQPVSIQPGDALIEVRGFSPEVSQAAQIRPGAGSIAVQGFAPAIGQGASVTPNTGLIEVRGFAPSVGQGQSILPGLGAVTLRGYAPSISQTEIPVTEIIDLLVTVRPAVDFVASIKNPSAGFTPMVGRAVTVVDLTITPLTNIR